MAAREALKNELLRVLDRVEPEKWGLLEKLIAEGKAGTMYGCLNFGGIGEDAAREVMTAAIEEIEHDRQIVRHRKELHKFIEQAQAQVQRAFQEIKNLDELYDVEYEGGSSDLEKFLEDAARALRAAQALKPTDKDGN